MGQSVLKGLCGKNLGYFPDTVDSPTDSDDEADADSEADLYMPKNHRLAVRQERITGKLKSILKVSGAEDVAVSGRGWGPYMAQVEVEGIRVPAIRAIKAKITAPMLERLKVVGSVHTLELTNCHLRDLPPVNHIDDLVVLRLSHNSIRTIHYEDSETAVKVAKLERFVCDWNRIETIAPGVFAGNQVSNLTAVNLAHNELVFLPSDFGNGAKGLIYLDLSYNKLQVLPNTLFSSCKKLQLLYLQRNDLRSLPSDLGAAADLRKLFLSHNKLKALPDSIGECVRLEKLRLIKNEIRYLPDSFLKLWSEEGGALVELLVEGTPLVQPSITAFDMGGLTRGMKLFKEWIEDKRQKELENGFEEGALMPIADEATPVSPRTGEVTFQSMGRSSDARYSSERSSGQGQMESESHDRHGEVAEENDAGHHYYFGHLSNNVTSEIRKIREAETKLLLKKKSLYIENQQRIGREMLRRHAADPQFELPEHIKEMLVVEDKEMGVKGFDPLLYTRTIPVTDNDLYFNLLVFCTRPMFSTCRDLFGKFQSDASAMRDSKDTDKMSLSLREWNNLCNRVPARLPPAIQEDIWNLLSSPDTSGNTIKIIDFIAGWHIHDIENQDPFIKRVTQVQRLDYYDMDLTEMQERLKAKGANHASLPLDFDGGGPRTMDIPVLAPLEGERILTSMQSRAQRQQAEALSTSHEKTTKEVLQQVSMSRAQYIERDNKTAHENAVQGDTGIDSDALSRDEDSEFSDFDALEMEERRRQTEAELEKDVQEMPSGWQTPKTPRLQTPTGTAARKATAGRQKKANADGGGSRVRDLRFKTDVFDVRRALREAYRNMPRLDFKTLINFLIRSLKRIQDFSNSTTYWHYRDPSFCYATGIDGMHPYVRKLLLAMGFAVVMDVYWVWPHKHLASSGEWGLGELPPDCPGLAQDRLDDMVVLVKDCQKALFHQGKNFTGHFGSAPASSAQR
mmetsp:Transcript_97555/g.203595  ORF Transcript_97555/g.203595 Transcript_97555/m.203595 type:complete len:964 (-) Transcript_97555:100-2991(-)